MKKIRMPKDCRQVQDAMDRASWDAVKRYRMTGDMVAVIKDGKLAFETVDEVLSAREDCAKRKRADGDRMLRNLVAAFELAKLPITPDVWDRLAADRKQALKDDLVWIERGRRMYSGGRASGIKKKLTR